MAKKGGKAKIKARKAEKRAKEKAAADKKKAKLAAEKAAREAKKAARVVPGEDVKQVDDNGELDSILNNPTLTQDQKDYIRTAYEAKKNGDTDTIRRLAEATKAATKFSDPYFKAQARIALDALDRGVSSEEGDLAYKEQQLKATLAELKANTEASRDYLSFNHAQELKQLAQKYEVDLSSTQDELAASGFTASSKRARAEQILSDQNQGLVESSTKQFGYQTGNIDRALAATGQDTEAQIANLRRLAEENKLDLLRQTEQTVGSGALPNVSGLNALGGVTGSIPYQQALDAKSFANSFVF